MPEATLQKELKQLLKTKTEQPSILSIYLNTSGDHEKAKAKVQIFLKHALQNEKETYRNDPAALSQLEITHGRLQKFLESELEGQFRGVALFISSSLELMVPFKSMIPFKNEYSFGKAPYLKQLLELSDNFKPTILVMVDSREAKILEIVLGSFFSKKEFKSDTEPRISMDGLSETKYQHRVDLHAKGHAKKVANAVSKLVDGSGFRKIILSGQDRNVAVLKEQLPKKIQEMVTYQLSLDKLLPDQKAVEYVLDHISAHEVEEEKVILNDLVTSARSNEKDKGATLGVRKTISACNQGLIRILVVSDSFSKHGFSCTGCKSIFESFEMQCPACGSRIEEVDLGYALMSRAKELDADIEVVSATEETFEEKDSIGAYLRAPLKSRS